VSAFGLVRSSSPRHRRRTGLHSAHRHVPVIWVYALTSLLLIALYPVLPALGRTADFLLVSCGALVPATMVLRERPRGHKSPWWFLLAALIALNLDNLTWYWYVDVKHLPTADGTISDLFGTVGHVLLLLSTISIVVRRGRSDVGGLLDAAIVSMAAGGLLWDVLLLPHMDATRENAGARLSMFFDIMILTAILGTLLRLLLTAREVIHALWLLILTLALSMTGNIVVAMMLDPVTGARPDWTNMIFMGAYVCLGLVALSRSSVLLTRPGSTPADDLTAGRLAFLGAALAAIPIFGGGRQVFGLKVDGALLAFGGAAVTALVMVRIGRLATQRTKAERALMHQATHDVLTGLPNRREFVVRLDAELARPPAARTGPVVLFCDLDGFKAINDRFGHAAGDALLAEVGSRLCRCVREGDVVSRFGGDEFLVLCREASPADAAELCRRISDILSVPIILDGESVTIGASIGAVTADREVDAEELIHRADALMYAAKKRRPEEAPGVRTVAA
jgi:diguanylate cyclase (GGDEF)-like protein